MDRMIRALLAAAAAGALALALGGCSAGRSAAPAPREVTERPPAQPEQISPSSPYCMYVQKAAQLRECQQFAFGRCQVWGSRCDTPGWVRPPGGGATEGPQGTGGAPAP